MSTIALSYVSSSIPSFLILLVLLLVKPILSMVHLYVNQKCPNAFEVVCQDQVSALAIGLAGVAQLLFGVTFPCFDEKSNYTNRIKFNGSALDFLYSKQRMGSPLDGGNTL
jgi:hypothetical protein